MDEFIDLIQAIVDHNLWDLHTAIPAKIIEINYESQKASVQPLIKERYRDADDNPSKGLADMPVILGVPVIFPSAGTGILSFPVKKGDKVLLVFSERSTDNFVIGDGETPVDPKDYRKHHYTDAFCIAGLYPFKKALGIHPDNAVFRMNVGTGQECKIELTPAGDIIATTPTKLTLNATNEVVVNTKKATVTASTSVKIDSPQTTCTGKLRVDGEISAGGDVKTDAGFSANTHKHIGNLGTPTSTFI